MITSRSVYFHSQRFYNLVQCRWLLLDLNLLCSRLFPLHEHQQERTHSLQQLQLSSMSLVASRFELSLLSPVSFALASAEVYAFASAVAT
jgi:uncharacterized membrane protein